MTGNNATGASAGSVGLGGGLYVADSCTNGICSSVQANGTSISMTGNFAAQAGPAACLLIIIRLCHASCSIHQLPR